MTQNAIALRDYARDLDVTSLGQHLVKSGFFADSTDVSKAVVKVLAGRELGIGPIASMTGIYIVKGRITLSANLVGALIQGSGRYRYRVTSLDTFQCTICFFEGKDQIGASTFTMDDAKQADLLSNPTYKKFPKNMLFSRALTNGARWFTPDVFSGPVYTPDELDAETVLDADNNVVSVPVEAAPALEAALADGVTPAMLDDYRALYKRGGALGLDMTPYLVDKSVARNRLAQLGKQLSEAINAHIDRMEEAVKLPAAENAPTEDVVDAADLAMIRAQRGGN